MPTKIKEKLDIEVSGCICNNEIYAHDTKQVQLVLCQQKKEQIFPTVHCKKSLRNKQNCLAISIFSFDLSQKVKWKYFCIVKTKMLNEIIYF